MAGGRAMGRSVLDPGPLRHRRRGSPPPAARRPARLRRRACSPPPRRSSPPGLLNRLTVRAFNELWYRKAPVRRARRAPDHPARSSTRSTWSAAGTASTGPRGFLQWQFAVPVRRRGHACAASSSGSAPPGCTSFLAVLKRVRPGRPRPAVVPRRRAGRSRSTSPPACAGLGPLLDELDDDGRRRRRPDLPGQGQPGPARAAAGHVPPPRRVAGRRASGSTPTGACRSDLARRLGLSAPSARRRPAALRRPRRPWIHGPARARSAGSRSSSVAVVVDHEVGRGEALLAVGLAGRSGPGRRPRVKPRCATRRPTAISGSTSTTIDARHVVTTALDQQRHVEDHHVVGAHLRGQAARRSRRPPPGARWR